MSPEAVGTPALNKDFFFFGRKDIVSLLYKRLGSHIQGYRQNIAILGPLYVGKTFLITHFLKILHPHALLPIYIHVTDTSLPLFTKQFIDAIISAVNADKYSLVNMQKTHHLIQAAQKSLERGNVKDVFKKLFDIPEVVAKESGKKVVLIIDEFDKIQRFKIRDFFTIVGKKIMIQKDIMYLLLSSSIENSKNILNNDLSLLFGKFEIITLDYFDLMEAKLFLKEKMAKTTIDPVVFDFLIGFTSANPFYLDVITDYMMKKDEGGEESIPWQTVKKVLQELMGNERGYLFQIFLRRCERFLLQIGPDMIEVLICLAQGKYKKNDIAVAVDIPGVRVGKIIDKLLLEDMIELDGSVVHIKDRVFKYWLKYIYAPIRSCQKPDIFQDCIESRFSQTKKYHRDALGLILHMLSFWRGEKIKREEKLIYLPHFEKIERHYEDSCRMQYVVCNGEVSWMVGIMTNDCMQEKDIIEYVAMTKRMPHIKMKICLSLKGIECNAHVIAKQHKVCVWESRDINKVLEMYEMPLLIE